MLPDRLQSLLDHLPDLRSRHTTFSIGEVVFLVLSGIMAGQTTLTEIEDWGEDNQDWLRHYFPYTRIPSHDTLGRVLGLMKPSALAEVFQTLAEAMSQHWQAQEALGLTPRHVALDGKALRGSYQQQSEPQMTVQAWDVSLQAFLGMTWVNHKENEIVGCKALVDALDLKGAVVTADAMNSQAAMARVILDKGGQFIAPIKDNRPMLKAEAELFVNQPSAAHQAAQSIWTETEKSHGRLETRTITWQPLLKSDRSPAGSRGQTKEKVKEKNKGHLLAEEWPAQGVVKVERRREYQRRTPQGTYEPTVETETQYYLSTWLPSPNLGSPAQVIGTYIRRHWDIEKAHDILDTAFREDEALASDTYLQRHLAALRRVAMTLMSRTEDPVQKRTQKVDKVANTWKAKMKHFDRHPNYRHRVWKQAGQVLFPQTQPRRVIQAKP